MPSARRPPEPHAETGRGAAQQREHRDAERGEAALVPQELVLELAGRCGEHEDEEGRHRQQPQAAAICGAEARPCRGRRRGGGRGRDAIGPGSRRSGRLGLGGEQEPAALGQAPAHPPHERHEQQRREVDHPPGAWTEVGQGQQPDDHARAQPADQGQHGWSPRPGSGVGISSAARTRMMHVGRVDEPPGHGLADPEPDEGGGEGHGAHRHAGRRASWYAAGGSGRCGRLRR